MATYSVSTHALDRLEQESERASMSSSLVSFLAAALTAQHPAAGSNPAPALSPEEVARLEATHLTNIRQVTFGLARAGEGYFSPDGHSIIFQAVPYLPPSIFHHPKPDEDGYQIYHRRARRRCSGQDGQHGQRALHLPVLSPGRQVDLVCLDPLEPQHRGRALQGPGV